MRRFSLLIFILALAVNCVAREETVEELKGRLTNARPEDRPELCVHIAQLQVKNADRLYTEGHVDEARTAIGEVVAYFEKARDAAIESKSHLKNVEIGARKSSEKLADIKRTLAFEDQAPVEQAIRRIEDVRTALLNEMFAGKKKDKE